LSSLSPSLSLFRKQDLKDKVQSDNPSFTSKRVEEEVDRFMMDAEGCNMYIKYVKDRKMNPQLVAQEELEKELSLSNPKTAATYAAWLIGGLSFGYFKNEVIEPKIASGEWQLPSFMSSGGSKPAVDAAIDTVSTTVSQVVDHAIQQSDSLTDYLS
jgi:hypothetical protein